MPKSSRSKTFTEEDRRIRVRVGDSFVIELTGIPGAGYEWALTPEKTPEKPIRLVKQEVVPGSGVGGAAAYRFHLHAQSAGSGQVTAEYRRSWEPQAEKVAAFEITVSE